MDDFEATIAEVSPGGLFGVDLPTLQVNLGPRCNQQCVHCHLRCSPTRNEAMDWPVMEAVIAAADAIRPELLDLTGGAPELHPNFRRLVAAVRRSGASVQVRTNLTVLDEPGQEDTPEFLRAHHVRLVASLPCYLPENVDAQRGAGVHRRSIEMIRRLNTLGYGRPDGLQLDLAYNPPGPVLPAEPSSLEADYRAHLDLEFGIQFTRLLTITNMPIGRFADRLDRDRCRRRYMQLLRDSYDPQAVPALMCRHQVSIGWDGTLYDCDFNLALHLPVDHGAPDHLRRFDPAPLATRRIVTGEHCFGCTAGHGSSCGGALVRDDP